MYEVLTTAPTTEPIILAEAKAHLRQTLPDDDLYIERLIKAARIEAENYTGRALHAQSWTQYLDGFPNEITLQRRPILDVTSIKYVDRDGVQQTLASSEYRVDIHQGRIERDYDSTGWPDTRAVINAVEVEYRAGYKDTAASPEVGSVPEDITQAILLMVGAWYQNRESVIVGNIAREFPLASTYLLNRRRVYPL